MIDLLIRASLDGAIVVSGAWLLLRVLPRLSPGVKALIWWCAAAKVVVSLSWGPPVALPILPPATAGVTVAALLPQSTPPLGPAAGAMSGSAPTETATGIPWTTYGLWLWAAGCVVSAFVGGRRWHATRRAISRAAVAPAHIVRLTDELSTLLSMRAPSVRLSTEVDTPLVTGLTRPVILLPERRFPEMSSEQQRMALCHELMHIKRRDMWLGCVPAAAERLFFFHPLVRLAAREFAFWREAACDAAVLRALGAKPHAYGRLLLDLGVSPTRSSLSAAGAAWSFSTMKRRINMLETTCRPSIRMRIVSGAAVALAMLAVAPLTLGVRASVRPAVAPHPEKAPSVSVGQEAAEHVESFEAQDDLRYVFFVSDDHTNMSGSRGDIEKARQYRIGSDPLFWLRKDGREYVIRDRTILAELQQVWSAVNAVGAEQSTVGSKQATIGARQAEIGSRQAVVGAEQAAIGARQASIGARQAVVAVQETTAKTEAERAALERDRRSLDDDMRALDVEMRKMDDKMRELDVPMRDLGDDMRVLDREMRVLDTKMREAEKKATAEMRALLDRAIAGGIAERVK